MTGQTCTKYCCFDLTNKYWYLTELFIMKGPFWNVHNSVSWSYFLGLANLYLLQPGDSHKCKVQGGIASIMWDLWVFYIVIWFYHMIIWHWIFMRVTDQWQPPKCHGHWKSHILTIWTQILSPQTEQGDWQTGYLHHERIEKSDLFWAWSRTQPSCRGISSDVLRMLEWLTQPRWLTCDKC